MYMYVSKFQFLDWDNHIRKGVKDRASTDHAVKANLEKVTWLEWKFIRFECESGRVYVQTVNIDSALQGMYFICILSQVSMLSV